MNVPITAAYNDEEICIRSHVGTVVSQLKFTSFAIN